MNHDLFVLRALARLSRQRKAVDAHSLALRAGGDASDVEQALARLARAGLVDALVEKREIRLRLTLAGLALAVATGARTEERARVASPLGRAIPVRDSMQGRRASDARIDNPTRRRAAA